MKDGKDKSTREILELIEADTPRILVRDEFGKQHYRKHDEVLDSDEVVRNSKGDAIVMARQPGRPKDPEPLEAPSAKLAELAKLRQKAIAQDPLVKSMTNDTDSSEVFDHVMRGLALEAASLEFERNEMARVGKETSAVSMRRVNVLKAIGDAHIKRRDLLKSAGVDMDSPAFARLFAFIIETMKTSMEDSGLRQEMVETVFARFGALVEDDDWNREAKNRMVDG